MLGVGPDDKVGQDSFPSAPAQPVLAPGPARQESGWPRNALHSDLSLPEKRIAARRRTYTATHQHTHEYGSCQGNVQKSEELSDSSRRSASAAGMALRGVIALEGFVAKHHVEHNRHDGKDGKRGDKLQQKDLLSFAIGTMSPGQAYHHFPP